MFNDVNEQSRFKDIVKTILICCMIIFTCRNVPHVFADEDGDIKEVISHIAAREKKIRDIRINSERWRVPDMSKGADVTFPEGKPWARTVERYAEGYTQRYIEERTYLIGETEAMPWHAAWATDGDRSYGMNYADNSGHIARPTGSEVSLCIFLHLLGHTGNPGRDVMLSGLLQTAEITVFEPVRKRQLQGKQMQRQSEEK